MKKIFFVFAMLFMTVISALAEESTQTFYTKTGTTYDEGHFTIEGTDCDGDGLFLHGDNTITIKAKNGEKITRVEFNIGYGDSGVGEYNREILVSHGDVDYSSSTINNVNATSLVISSNITGNGYSDYLQIDEITVYYELGNAGNNGENNGPSIPDDYVLTESFANGGEYLGDNVKVDGLYIGNGKTVTISPNNDNDVRIFKVDLEFSNQFNGTINSLDGSIVEGSGTSKTISNVFSPSLTISSPDASGQISNITVYYVKMSEEKNQAFATKNGTEYIVADGRINVIGTECTGGFGLDIDGGQSVTITSNYGAEISKVELHLYYHEGLDIESTVGKVTGKNKDWTISDINSSSLTISYPNYYETEEFIQIDRITVYYKEPVINSEMVVAASPGEGFYWTTFYSNACNYQAPEGTEVYKVNLNGTKVTMSKIEDGIVTRCQGVVLKSTTENITMTKTDEESSDDYYGNSLWGTSSRITNPDYGNVYVLGNKESAGVAFYKLKSTGTIRANKAYLKANNSAAANAFFNFDFDATATGVDSINAQENEENAEVKIYDLQGRRVANPGKGIYIVNGKKVLMK
ncbi:MAG: hypothetical protein II900_08600 [Prevotella sp.]|nr:hypothetical protein [Prevotella sp.]